MRTPYSTSCRRGGAMEVGALGDAHFLLVGPDGSAS
jgi:hypothetical protein